ncbi:MAG: hypothetical protein A2287_06475 [Candidatus Melainabacteria bacterium RIFOXYA12_FULL_32_12]|nr:MAG: hypothetical protein A2255_04670 [Candidatus Melainabacteria bacterium RIFOXYA2_FULL_32_9]OGI26331.1 MAG: hypothetical protein A2287_06475 [Candidatus Melainabacteria bacterium RIFOXYA12_FULL_32_12]
MSFKDTDGNGTGDIKGITENLDYLKDLGVNSLWLNPIYTSPEKDNGYDISDYKGINPKYGSMKDMEELIQEDHKRDLHIIMDLVVNHSSDQLSWFKAARDPNHPEHKKYKDYYIWAPPAKNGEVPNNWVSDFAGSAWTKNYKTNEYYFHTFLPEQPELNWRNPKVREAVNDILSFWLKKGIDGFRMDVIDHVGVNKPFRKPNKSFVDFDRLESYIKGMGKVLYDPNIICNKEKEIMTVGETPATDISNISKVIGPNKLNMVFNFDMVNTDSNPNNGSKWTDRKPELKDIKTVFTKWQSALEKEVDWYSIFLMNHDQPRALSRFGNDSTEEFREASAKMLATMLFSLKGTPYMYMGEEIGMTNPRFDNINDYKDVETHNHYKEVKEKMPEQEIMAGIKAKSRDNARTPMQWNNSMNAGFTTGTPWINLNPNYTAINVEAARKDPNSIYNYFKNMIKLRKDNPVLIYGKYDLIAKDNEKVYSYTRTLGKEKILVVLNFSEKNTEFSLEKYSTNENKINMSGAKLLIGNYSDSSQDKKDLLLKPYEARVYKLSLD